MDFTNYIPGPFASLRLADMGADVVKIEQPDGDPSRQFRFSERGAAVVFEANNLGKKSLALNMKDGGDLEVARQLVKSADVVIESFRPGVMDKLGLGYEKARELKNDIIFCSISGFGQTGSLSALASHDLNYMALSGVLAQWKDGEGKPTHPTITMADMIGGLHASEAILAALFKRNETGDGTYLDISLMDALISMMNNHALIYQETGLKNGVPPLSGEMVAYGLYETKDNRYVSLGALEPKFWINFCNGIDRSEWIPEQFSKTIDENPVYVELKKVFQSKTLTEWSAFGEETDCCLFPVLETDEAIHSHFVKERGLVHHTSDGRTMPVPRYTEATRNMLFAPELSEHTDEIVDQLIRTKESTEG